MREGRGGKQTENGRVFCGCKLRRLTGNPLSDFLPPRGGGLRWGAHALLSSAFIPPIPSFPRKGGRGIVFSTCTCKAPTTIPEGPEFLAEVVYYNEAQPGLGERFAAAVEEAAARAVDLLWCSARARRLVREWARLHEHELRANWKKLKALQPPRQIAPLE